MAYQDQTELLKDILEAYATDAGGLTLSDYLVQSGVVLPEALTDAECSRAWSMGDEDGGQDYSSKAFRESLLLVAQRAFPTPTARSQSRNRLVPSKPKPRSKSR